MSLKPRSLSRVGGAATVLALTLSFASPAAAAPVLGNMLFYTGGTVTVDVLAPTASFTSDLDLYLFSPTLTVVAGQPDFGTNHDVGRTTTFNPGTLGYSIGQELMFGIYVRNTGFTYVMGAASRNPDNVIHAAVDSLGGGVYIVGFEDLFGGGDQDYDDHNFRFTGGIVTNPVPEPSTLLLLGMAVAGLSTRRRR